MKAIWVNLDNINEYNQIQSRAGAIGTLTN